MKIKKISIEANYLIETDEPLLAKMLRYSEDDWVLLYDEEEIQIKDYEEIELEFQRTLLLNATTDN